MAAERQQRRSAIENFPNRVVASMSMLQRGDLCMTDNVLKIQ
jgi:hypothetical protein